MTAVADPTTTEPVAVADGNTVVEPAVDLSAFNDAVTNAISDGAPTDAEIKAVRKAYGDLEPRKGKSAARAQLDDDVRSAISGSNMVQAQALFAIMDAIKKSGGLKGTRTAAPKNPTEAHVARVLAIQLGFSLAYANVPEGVPADWTDQVKADATLESQATEYRTWLNGGQEGDEPSVPEVAKAGARISLGKAPKGQGRKPGGTNAAPVVDTAAAPAAEALAAPEGWEA